MVTDLPDYEKKIIIVTPPGEYPAVVQVDLRKILGVDLISPTITGCVPTSIENEAIAYDAANDWFKQYIENPAIAYNSVTDRFKVDIEALTLGALTVIQSDETLLKATVTQAAKDRTVTGTVTAEQSDQTKLKATVTQAAKDRTVTGTVTAEQATAASLKGTVYQSDETQLKATVTQAAKDRTISSVDATATPLQISLTALTGNSAALLTPAAGKAIRIKFISLEHSADVDIGYRFGAAGTIWYLRITKGVYLSNLIGCNNQGAADAALYLNSSGATNVKGYILYSEV